MDKRIPARGAALMAALALIVIALLAGGTTALFTTSSTSNSVVTAGDIALELHDRMDTPEGIVDFPENGMDIMPGDVVSKIATVENTGNHPLFARVQISKSSSDQALPVDRGLSMTLNTTQWIAGSDGFYYYHRALEPGEETEPLFDKVTIDPQVVDNAFLGHEMRITLTAHAVQSENNGSDPCNAVGWPQ